MAAFQDRDLVADLADADSFLVLDASDTTEHPLGTVKRALATQVVTAELTVNKMHGPLMQAEYDALPVKSSDTLYLIVE